MILLLFFGCQEQLKNTSAQDGPLPWRSPEEAGNFAAGIRTIEWIDSRGKALEADVWYPAHYEDGDDLAMYEPTTLSISAYRNAVPAVVDAPLIAFSHGFLAIRFQSAFLMEHLAQHGFVVIAPDHPNNTFLDFDDDETVTVLLERPDDIRASVDELARRTQDEDDFLYRIADTESYSVIGHSFGSHTAMVLGGGALDYSGLLVYCEENPGARPCSYLSGVDLDVVDDHGGPDPRVVSSIPMSPGLWYTFGASAEGLNSLNESLVMAGVLDEVLEYETEALPTFSAIGEPKTLAIVPGAGHYGFTDICLLAEELTPECGSMDAPEFLAIDTIKQMTKTLVTAYLGANMLLDDRYSTWLGADAWDPNLLQLTSNP